MRAALIIIGLLLLLAVVSTITVTALGIWGFGPREKLVNVVVKKTALFQGRYIVQTKSGTFEVDSLAREQIDSPAALFESIQANQVYNLTVLGSRHTFFGKEFLPYIIEATPAPTSLPANFRPLLRERGYENIPSSDMWVNWETRTLLTIEGPNYSVLVGPAPEVVAPPAAVETPPSPPPPPPRAAKDL